MESIADVDPGIVEILTVHYGRCVPDAALAVQRRALALHLRAQSETDEAVLARLRPRIDREHDGVRDALNTAQSQVVGLKRVVADLREEVAALKRGAAVERTATAALVEARRATYAAEQRVENLERELRASRLAEARVEHDRLILARTLAQLRAERVPAAD